MTAPPRPSAPPGSGGPTHLEHGRERRPIVHVLPDEDLLVAVKRARVAAVRRVVQVLAGVQVEEVAEVVVHADRCGRRRGLSLQSVQHMVF